MKTAVLPITKLLQIPSGTDLFEEASAIPLTDSDGNSFEANWIKVTPVSGDNQVFAGIFFSSISNVVVDVENTTGATIGSVFPTDDRGAMHPIEIFFPDSSRFSEVQVGVSNGNADTVIAITYGYRVPINPLRARMRV
jgi:hypothetical protein